MAFLPILPCRYSIWCYFACKANLCHHHYRPASMSIIPTLQKTRVASAELASLSNFGRQNLLLELANAVEKSCALILEENQKDLDKIEPADPKRDRLFLSQSRIAEIAHSIRRVAQLDDPTGVICLEKQLPNGLLLRKILVPLGVIGIIYESRPNVTLDVAALCLRSANACVLRGGSDAWHTNLALVGLIHNVLKSNHMSEDLVALLPPDRALLPELLTATRWVDVIIPRGSDELIQYVRQNATVPTIETGAGVVHTYLHKSANLDMAAKIIVNAKTSRPAVCNALDCILVDRAICASLISKIKAELEEWKVEIHADQYAYHILSDQNYPYLKPLQPADLGKEWLDFKLTLVCVETEDEAFTHIAAYSSRHSEAIIAEDVAVSERFIREVDSAVVYINASTRFTDGGEFGLGAEMGISTQKLHARGPFALEKLVTEKWLVAGNGQIRI